MQSASAGACAAGMLPVQRQQEAADRIGGETAVIDQLGPVGVAGFDRILPEGAQQVARLHEPGPVLRVDGMQPRRLGNGSVAADERLPPARRGAEAFRPASRSGASAMSSAMRTKAVEGENRIPVSRRESTREATGKFSSRGRLAGCAALRAHGFTSAG